MRSSSGGDRRSDRQEDTNLLILSKLDTLSADMFQLRGKVDEYTRRSKTKPTHSELWRMLEFFIKMLKHENLMTTFTGLTHLDASLLWRKYCGSTTPIQNL